MRLLLVEDDVELAKGLASSLAQSGYDADVAHDGQAAMAACADAGYSLIILDLGLPDMDGLEVLRRLRFGAVKTPVLILTARDEPQDRVVGLDALSFGLVHLELESRHATVNGHELELTARELAVLEMLMRRPGRIVSKAQIFNSLYDWQDNASLSAVEVFVSRLRRKLGQAEADVGIRVFRGLGYRLEQQGDAAS